MAWYAFQELTLEVTHASPACGKDVARLLQEFSWVRTAPTGQPPTLRLAVHQHTGALCVPARARLVFRAEGFCGVEQGDAFYLTDGSSLLHLQIMQGQGTAQLAPTFVAQPRVAQRNFFWTFALLKLLRPLGFYSLHAAGVVPAHGQGVLIIGPSGSGKSTLTLGLLRQGWGYVSDDTVLLRLQPEGVVAMVCRKYCYVDAGTAARYAELPFGEAAFETHGGGNGASTSKRSPLGSRWRRVSRGYCSLPTLSQPCKAPCVRWTTSGSSSTSSRRAAPSCLTATRWHRTWRC